MVFLKAVFFLTLLTAALGCSCAQSTFRARYCRQPVVVRGRVVAKFDNCPGTCDEIDDQGTGEITYVVKVMKTFKGTEPEDGVMFLTTAVNSGLCGVVLSVGTSYYFTLFNPSVRRKQCPRTVYSVGLCDFPTRWKDLTKGQKSFVFRNSKNGNRSCPVISSPAKVDTIK